MSNAEPGHRLAVLLPYRHRADPDRPFGSPAVPLRSLCFCASWLRSHAQAESGPATLSPLQIILKWTPLLSRGFAFNIAIALLAMALGTIAGLGLGLALLSDFRRLRRVAGS